MEHLPGLAAYLAKLISQKMEPYISRIVVIPAVFIVKMVRVTEMLTFLEELELHWRM